MLNRHEEYQKMNEVENTLWWYRCLHSLVTSNIQTLPKDTKILDAGCGTGGLLLYLHQKGYTNMTGFDLSQDAIHFAKSKLLPIDKQIVLFQHNLVNPIDKGGEYFDVIISNDTLYYFSVEEQKKILIQFHHKLSKNGLVILNLPAFDVFSGIHDDAVGIRMRFSKKNLKAIVDPDLFDIVNLRYWPMLLSPIIYLVRLMQRRKKQSGNYEVVSDVNTPPKLINDALFFLTQFETFLDLPFSIGSSLFVILKTKK